MAGKRRIHTIPAPIANTFAAAATSYARLAGIRPLITIDMLRWLTMNATFSGEKAARDLGFTPPTHLDAGLKHVQAWFHEIGPL